MNAEALLARIEAIVTPRADHLGLPEAVADILSPRLAVILEGRDEIDAVLTALHASAGRTGWLNLDDVDHVHCFHVSDERRRLDAMQAQDNAGCPAYFYERNGVEYVAIVLS